MEANERFAVAILGILGEVAGASLVTAEDRPAWGDIELLQARASSGERALIDLAYDSWRAAPGSVAAVFGRCDRKTARAVLEALETAYEPAFT